MLGWEKTAVIGWSGRRGVAGVGWGGQWAMKVQNLRNFFSRAERPATGPNLPKISLNAEARPKFQKEFVETLAGAKPQLVPE